MAQSTEQPTKVRFEDYEWEQDEEWQVLVKKLEFPGHFDEAKKEKHLLKRKQKYFQERIDPDFVPTKPKATAPPKPEPAKTENEATAQSTSSEPSIEEEKAAPSTSSQSNYSSNQSSSYQHPYGRYQPPPTYIGTLLSPFLNYYYLLSQWFVFISCLLSMISPRFFYRALYATILMYVVNTLQQNGKPQWNMYYAQRVMQDENVMIAIYAAIFLMANPVFVFLAPIILRSFFMGVYLLNGILGQKIPSLYYKARPLTTKVLTKQGWFIQRIAMLEVMVGIFLIFACFFMSRTVIVTFIYWQIMHARYMMSAAIQNAFTNVHQKLQQLFARVPFVLNLYMKLAGYLWNMVDPQRIQQQMQQQQGAGGAVGSLLKKCVIM